MLGVFKLAGIQLHLRPKVWIKHSFKQDIGMYKLDMGVDIFVT